MSNKRFYPVRTNKLFIFTMRKDFTHSTSDIFHERRTFGYENFSEKMLSKLNKNGFDDFRFKGALNRYKKTHCPNKAYRKWCVEFTCTTDFYQI